MREQRDPDRANVPCVQYAKKNTNLIFGLISEISVISPKRRRSIPGRDVAV